MPSITQGLRTIRSLLIETAQVYWILLKVMVPALVIVKVLQEFGAIDGLGTLLSPLMTVVGLPAVLGVVWATTLLTNILTGIVIFFEVAGDLSLTVEQVTVLGTLMLIGHSIPVEGAVARKAGVPWWTTIALRVGGALFLGGLIHWVCSEFNVYQEAAHFVWHLEGSDGSLLAWSIAQLNTLVLTFFIILALILFLRLLNTLGLERLMHIALAPLLRVLGIGHAAANITVIGVALGLSYGAGLLIRDLEKGVMSRRDGYLALCFLGLTHSMIEDTLLIMLMGAELSGILWARLVFSIAVIALIARWIHYREERLARN